MRALVLLLALQIPLGLDSGLLAPPDNLGTLEKAELGRRLFSDKRLSADHSRACADCHERERAFTDGKRVAVGIQGQQGTRNAPAILNRTYWPRLFLGWTSRHPRRAGPAADPASERDGRRPVHGDSAAPSGCHVSTAI